MPWSDHFLSALRGDFNPGFLLESVAVGAFAGSRELALSSVDVPGYRSCIDPSTSSMSHGELQVPAWVRSATSITLSLTRDVRREVQRGQTVQLRVGSARWSIADYETVFVGAVRSLRWSAGRWQLQLVDLAYSLQSRPVAPDEDPRLFASLGDTAATTSLSTSYSPGDTVLDVATVAGAERVDGESYLLLVSPASGAEPFFLTATGTAGSNYTGCSTVGLFGTTAVAAGAGSVVATCAYQSGHPINVVRRWLVSTGTGAHGTRDKAPATWGYAIPPALVDGEDCERQIDLSSPATGTSVWAPIVTDPVDDGLSYLQQFLQPGGFFLGLRQGAITVRAVADPYAVTAPSSWSLTDGHVESYETWDAGIVEARGLQMYPGSGPGNAWATAPGDLEELDTRPSRLRVSFDAPDVWDNEDEWGESIERRIGVYLLRAGERLTLRSAGYRLAGAAIGDELVLTTDQVESRYRAEGWGFSARRTLITGGGVDWFRGTCRYNVLSHVPGARRTS